MANFFRLRAAVSQGCVSACLSACLGAADAGVSFDTADTVVWRGAPQMVAFRVEPAADTDQTLATRVQGGGLRVLEPARVLEGETLGFVRVVADGPVGDGHATLHVGGQEDGDALAVWLRDAADPDKQPDADDAGPAAPVLSPRPRIVAPASGAAVWGARVGVAVEAFDDPAWPDAPLSVRLRLPDGRRLAPVEISGAGEGPVRRYGFVVDSAALATGWNDLVAESSRGGGAERDAWTAAPVPVFRLDAAAAPDDVEAESRVDAPRPDRYHHDGKPLNLADDPDASGGVYVRNRSNNPALTVPLSLDTAGWVQLRVTAGGDPAQGVLPSVGLRLGDEPQPRSASRIALRAWHETPVGVPVWFEAGEHTLVVVFENDYAAGNGVDRNLKLDRLAVARLPAGWSPAPAATAGVAELDPSLDGREVGGIGAFAVSGQVRTRSAWSKDDLRRPAATLWINGVPTRTQHSFAPRFELAHGALDSGPNRLELRAVDPDGGNASGYALTVHRAANTGAVRAAAPAVAQRFLAADPAWSVSSGDAAPSLTAREGPWGDPIWSMNSNAELTLNLPDGLRGRYALHVDAAGDAFEGPPEVEVRRLPGAGGAPDEVSTLKVAGGFWPRPAGEIELDGAEGAAIVVAFVNDRYDADRPRPNDRNVRIRAVELRPVAEAAVDEADDSDPPRAVVVYPPDGHAVFNADAVVVELAGDVALKSARLLLDDEPWGPALPPDGGRTRLLLPVALRGVSPGTYRWSVRVTDAAGETTDTASRAVRVLDTPPDTPGPYARAVRLLNRVAYGPEPAALADVLVDGAGPWLRAALARGARPAGEAAAWSRARAAYPDARSGYALGVRAAAWLVETPNPARARLTMFVDNHFNTWWAKSRPESKGPEFARWVALGPAPFAELLRASATSASMVYYLDQQRSFKGRINENYAREVMELHTLGVHGGYTQADVTALAHVLTGWSAADVPRSNGGGDFTRRRWAWVGARHDGAATRVFGLEVPAAADDAGDAGFDRPRRALEMLAAHPRTARHIAGKLAEHYLGVTSDAAGRAEVIDRLARVFVTSGGDLAQVVIALAESEALASATDAPRVAHPLGFAVRLARLAGNRNAHLIAGFAGRSGFAPFGRETPDGYPEEDAAYADSNAMLQRWRLASDLEWALYLRLPEGLRHPPRRGDAPPDAGDAAWHQELVDQAALRFTGRLLSDRSNAAVLSVLAASDAAAGPRGRLAATLVAQMPEGSLR